MAINSFLLIKRTFSFYYLFLFLIILGCDSFILALDPELCNTPINITIGVNDKIYISPLKSTYEVGDKIIVKFIIDNNALQSNTDEIFEASENRDEFIKLFESTNENKTSFFHTANG